MFHQCLAHDVNLRGTFFMTRAFFSITTAAAAIARVPFVRPAGIIIIFGRGFWRCRLQHSFLASLLQAPKQRKEKYKKNQKLGLRELAKVSSVQPGPA
jgi:hypothetical protein